MIIPEYKFSSVEMCENGIHIKAKVSSDSEKSIYISDTDMMKILTRYFDEDKEENVTNSVSNNGIEEAIY